MRVVPSTRIGGNFDLLAWFGSQRKNRIKGQLEILDSEEYNVDEDEYKKLKEEVEDVEELEMMEVNDIWEDYVKEEIETDESIQCLLKKIKYPIYDELQGYKDVEEGLEELPVIKNYKELNEIKEIENNEDLYDLINSKEKNISNNLKEVEELRELTEYNEYKGNMYIDIFFERDNVLSKIYKIG